MDGEWGQDRECGCVSFTHHGQRFPLLLPPLSLPPPPPVVVVFTRRKGGGAPTLLLSTALRCPRIAKPVPTCLRRLAAAPNAPRSPGTSWLQGYSLPARRGGGLFIYGGKGLGSVRARGSIELWPRPPA